MFEGKGCSSNWMEFSSSFVKGGAFIMSQHFLEDDSKLLLININLKAEYPSFSGRECGFCFAVFIC